MQYIDVQGMRVPALGLGTWQLRGDVCRRVVEQGIEIGYRAIDTAQFYDNEAEIGAALAVSQIPRAQFFITTKLWPDELASDASAIDASLERLDTDYVDMLLIHWPSRDRSLADSLTPLTRAYQDQKARSIGVSNFPSAMLQSALALAPIAGNQVEYHPYLAQNQLLQVTRAQQLILTAYCPLARGQVNRDATIQELARRHGKTPAQVTLRWLIQQHRVATIPKAADKQHLASNFAIFDFALSNDEMARMAGLARGLRLVNPAYAPAWDG